MSKYLVTGGAGFIGSNLVERLVDAGNDVVIVDDLSMGKVENLDAIPQNHITFYEKSITDSGFMSRLLVSEKFDYIVLLGAVASVADSVERPIETHSVNQEANINIYETIRRHKLRVKKVLFASSAAVYGDDPVLPKKETSNIVPLTPYAIDKFASERYAIIYGKLYGIPTVCTRFFNVYGPNQNPESPYSGVLSIIQNCLKNGKTFKLFGNGEQTRDFTYVDDVVDALLLLLSTPEAKWDVYNVATGKRTSLNSVIDSFEKATGKKLDIVYAEKRKGDIKDSFADVTKLKGLGYMPKYDIESGLKKYLELTDRN